ncbi:MAG: hypothetical protein QOJ40_382 [Verrucomicrobiota bacterium]
MLKSPASIVGWQSCLLVCLLLARTVVAQADLPVYTDSLVNGFQDWGWASHNYANTSPVHSGADSISVTISSTSYEGLQIYHPDLDSSPYSSLSFWINGGPNGGQKLQVYGLLHQGTTNNAGQGQYFSLGTLPTNTWRQFVIPLSALGVANRPNFTGFVIQDRIGAVQPTFYVDDITLLANTGPVVTNTSVSITIDALLNRHPISPLIYGTAFAGSNGLAGASNQLADLNAPLHRSGGNSETSYNWQLNAHNRAADWYFESLDDGSATPADSADNFVAASQNGGSQPMLTIPMIGWLPKLGPGRARLSSYSIAKYGPQTGNDWQWFPDAGNGVRTNGSLIITNDPTDADFLTNSSFQRLFVQHLTNRWGLSANGGVRYYLMDNEHTLWHSTHRDVHPVGTTMQEIRDKTFDYATMVKSLDPSALVLGPEEWGWPGYLYSGYDQQWSGANNDYNPAHYPDRLANGGWDYMPWLLDQFRQRATNTNQRLLDYFTLHIYPQGANESGNDVSTTTQLARNRSTRALWDTNHIDASWINSIIMLIPRMNQWAAAYYPGTKIGITEYNWGAEGHINGATAQADILGIFGREGLDLATRWTTPDPGTPTYKAMKLYRNYDGNKSCFGDTSVSATGPDPDNVSTFAAIRSSDGALTAMVINKQLTASATATMSLSNFLSSGTAQMWQLTSANAITHPGPITFTGNSFSNTLPAQSITLFVLAPGNSARLRAGIMSGNQFDFWLDAQAGQRYIIQKTTNLVNWVPVQTNMLAGNSVHIVISPASPAQQFYRAQWAP